MTSKSKLSQVVSFETADGSTTLVDEERNLHYRSRHGAKSESQHVFLDGTNLRRQKGEWRVVELGFGAAVNFTQTVAAFRKSKSVERLIYHSVDWRPVTARHLDFHCGEGGILARRALAAVHDGQHTLVEIESTDGAIELHLHARPWDEVQLPPNWADAFFFDPFSKRANPEAWTTASFSRAKAAMDDGARLATYSAATSVKQAMFKAGLWVASAPGPGRKREMTVASPSREPLDGLTLLERSRYLEKS